MQLPSGGRDIGSYVRADMWETDKARVVGRAVDLDHLRDPNGQVRAAALCSLIDFAGGVGSGLASLPDGWVVTTNLAVRTVAGAHRGPLRIDSEVLRRGRNNVVAHVQIHDEGDDDALVADGVLTSAILVPEDGPPQWERPMRITRPPMEEPPPVIDEWLALRRLDANGSGQGVVEVDLTDNLRNPWGIMHGGVVAFLVDLATAHASGGATTDVVLHFLAPNRTGPVRATAQPLGTRRDGTVCRVEVRDLGADRTTAVAIATARV
jgi:uncharacterized protein (TIGR00369 family)